MPVDDKILFWAAALTAALGLTLLWLSAPVQEEGYRLEGTVVASRSGGVLVNTNVTLVTRKAKVGSIVNSTVFWADDKFIAPRQ